MAKNIDELRAENFSLQRKLLEKNEKCNKLTEKVENLEQEVFRLVLEKEKIKMLNYEHLRKDEIVEQLTDFVLLGEAIWQKVHSLEQKCEIHGLLSKGEKTVSSNQDQLSALGKLNDELLVVKKRIKECEAMYMEAQENSSSVFSLLPFSFGFSQSIFDYFRKKEKDGIYKDRDQQLVNRISKLCFEFCQELVKKQMEVNKYAEALLEPFTKKSEAMTSSTSHVHNGASAKIPYNANILEQFTHLPEEEEAIEYIPSSLRNHD